MEQTAEELLEVTPLETIIALIIGLGMMFLAVYIPYRIIKAIVNRIKGNKPQKKQKKVAEPIDYTRIPQFTVVGSHVNGLPIAENMVCEVMAFSDRYEFHAGGATFELERNKVTDISIKTDKDIQKQYVSSVGGAVGGAVLFGPLGAMIGGRAKEKKSTTIYQYLIFTYLKDEEMRYIGIECTNQYWKATKIEFDFEKNKPAESNVKISL